MNIALIGVGLMGHGIATSLLRHGHAVRLFDHPGNQPVDDLLAAGATRTDRLADVARDVDALLVCVTGSPQVEAVLLGPPRQTRGDGDDADGGDAGALSGLRAGAFVIDCSTAVPSSTQRIAEAVTRSGGRFLDAAMTRTPREAAAGRLNLLVGGSEHDLQAVRPMLSAFAENVTHAGAVGAGHRMKLLHNYVSLGTLALLAEAAACARREGLDAQVFVDVLAAGGGGGVALERMRPYLCDGDPSALKFFMSNARKDLDYYATMAQDAGAADAIARAVLASYERGVHEASADAYALQLVDVLAEGRASNDR